MVLQSYLNTLSTIDNYSWLPPILYKIWSITIYAYSKGV